jgi:hypothetical protein
MMDAMTPKLDRHTLEYLIKKTHKLYKFSSCCTMRGLLHTEARHVSNIQHFM